MNINQLTSQSLAVAANKRFAGDEMLAMLQEQHSFSPAKDDYYQTHLTQLQRLELSFSALITEQKHEEHPLVTNTAKARHMVIDEQKQAPTSFATVHEYQKNESTILKPTTPITSQDAALLLSTHAFLGAGVGLECPLNLIASNKTQQPAHSYSLLEMTDVRAPTKLFHSFNKGNEVEFSLNTKGLNSRETKELLSSLKSYLKKKGLFLKKLLLNGVSHD